MPSPVIHDHHCMFPLVLNTSQHVMSMLITTHSFLLLDCPSHPRIIMGTGNVGSSLRRGLGLSLGYKHQMRREAASKLGTPKIQQKTLLEKFRFGKWKLLGLNIPHKAILAEMVHFGRFWCSWNFDKQHVASSPQSSGHFIRRFNVQPLRLHVLEQLIGIPNI